MIADKMQPTAAWRTIQCHIKVYYVFNEVLLLAVDNPGIICLTLKLGASELSSKGKESSVHKANFCCPAGNNTMLIWDCVLFFTLEVVKLSLCLKSEFNVVFCSDKLHSGCNILTEF